MYRSRDVGKGSMLEGSLRCWCLAYWFLVGNGHPNSYIAPIGDFNSYTIAPIGECNSYIAPIGESNSYIAPICYIPLFPTSQQ